MDIILRQNEGLIKTVRRHWIFVAPSLAIWLALVALVIIVHYAVEYDFFFGYWPILLPLVVVLAAAAVGYKFYLWRANELHITNQRVINHDQHGIFSKTVTELIYKDILQISYEKSGVMAAMYDYGDLNLDTASEHGVVTIKEIPAPETIVETVNQARENQAGQTQSENTPQAQPPISS